MMLLSALLTPNIGLMFWTILIFLLLLFILRKFAWKPIMSALKDREEGIEKAREVIIEAVKTVEGVMLDKPVEALFLEFGDSSLNFRIRWWLDSYVDTRRMFDSVNTAIYKALNEANIEIPFPQRVVTHKGLSPQYMSNADSD